MNFCLLYFGLLITGVTSLKCYQCDSEANPECSHASGEDTTTVECNSDATSCIVKIENGTTYRSCHGSDSSGDQSQKCKRDLCNGGVFPKDRLQCYQCEGTGCMNITNEHKPQPCKFYNARDQCITDVLNDKNAIRKCESDLKDDCSKNCQKCKTNGCNNQPGIIEVTCIQCSYILGIPTSENIECIRQREVNGKCTITGQKECKHNVTLGNKDQCYTYHKYHTVERGCYTRAPALDPGHLKKCSGNNCNDGCIGIMCIRCDSNKDPKCKSAPTFMKGETCPDSVSSCFSCEDTRGRVNRGCGLKENRGNFCYDCHDRDACNNEQIRTCYKCTSTEDPQCATWTNQSTIALDRCHNSTDDCVATVVFGTYTVRGCRSSVVECTHGDPNCKRCGGSICNDGIVPLDRLACHQCNDSDACNKDQSGKKGPPCGNYRPDDVCFAYPDQKTKNTVRGCGSDKLYRECLKLNSKTANTCRICYDSHCNSWSLT